MFPTPEDRDGTGSYGRPIFLPDTTKGTMVNAEGKTVPISIPKILNLQFTNVSRASDSFVMAVSFVGTRTPVALFARTFNAHRYSQVLPPSSDFSRVPPDELKLIRVLSMAANLAEVENDPDGTKM